MPELMSSESSSPGIRWFAPVLVLFLLWAAPLSAGPKEPSLKKGDPPPGNAGKFTDRMARIALASSLYKQSGTGEVRQGLDWFAYKSQSGSEAAAVPPKRFPSQETSFLITAPSSSQGFLPASQRAPAAAAAEESARRFVRYENVIEYVRVREHRAAYTGEVHTRDASFGFSWASQSDAQDFADALNHLAYSAHIGSLEANDRAAFEHFQKSAAAWRQLTTKPTIPPETDRYRVLAENAYEEKKLEDSAMYYDQALAAFDAWPEGWFNAGLIYSELNEYWEASDHMKHYLELAPDAPNSKTAREKWIIWSEKAKTETAGMGSDSANSSGLGGAHKSKKR